MSYAKGKITGNLKQLATECDIYHSFSVFFYKKDCFL